MKHNDFPNLEQMKKYESVSENKSFFSVVDKYEVSTGHTLVIPKRFISSINDLEWEEQKDMIELIIQEKKRLETTHWPDGFNIGINEGEAAGQTIGRLHIHIIPRYNGDCKDPVGGIRKVINGNGNY